MRIAELIATAEKRLVEIKDMTTEIMKSVEEDDRDLLPEESAQLEQLEADAQTTKTSLEGYRRAEQILAQRAQSVQSQKTFAAPKSEKPGQLLIKTAACHLLAYYKQTTAADIARSVYSGDQRVETVVKSAVDSATTFQDGWAAELVDGSIRGFLDDIRPNSIFGRLSSLGLDLTFGQDSSITVPGWGGGPRDIAGSFVGENRPIPVKRSTVTSRTLNRFKMAVISTFSEELSAMSTPAIEGLIRTKIEQDTIETIDVHLFDAAPAVAGLRPASILNGVVGTVSSGGTVENIMTDLKRMLAEFTANRRGRVPVWVMTSQIRDSLSMVIGATDQFLFQDELGNGRLLGRPVLDSLNVPDGYLMLIDAADFAAASQAPSFAVTREATLVMLNDDGTNPTMDMAAGTVRVDQAAGVTGGPGQVHSLFQQHAVGLRMILPISWGMLRDNSVVLTTGVNY